MRIAAIVGPSQSGKTRLISGLIREFKKRGLSVAAVKHCHHGFVFDVEGKDSWIYKEAGADGVAVAGPGETAIFLKNSDGEDFRGLAEKYFNRADIVLVEGGKRMNGLRKIEVVRRGVAERLEISPQELLAVVSDGPLTSDTPVFRDSQITELADFLISKIDDKAPRMNLAVDGREIVLNPIGRSFPETTTLGSLRGVPNDTRRKSDNDKN